MCAAPRTRAHVVRRETHGPGADHEDGVTGTDRRSPDAVQPDRVGLDERRVAWIDVVGDGERGRRRHRRELGEPTRASAQAHEDGRGAVDDVAGKAPVAPPQNVTGRTAARAPSRQLCVPGPSATTSPPNS